MYLILWTAIKKLYFILVAACLPLLLPSTPTNLFVQGGARRETMASRQVHKEKQTVKQTSAHQQSAVCDKKVTQSEPQQPEGLKLFSCAMSTLETFAKAQVFPVRWRNETRPRSTALVDAVKIDLLYNTEAMSSCSRLRPTRNASSTSSLTPAKGP